MRHHQKSPFAVVAASAALLGLALLSSSAIAARPAQAWQIIAANGGERLELDKSRISRLKSGQTAAWSRLTLGFDLPDSTTGVSYTAIEALNTYDCGRHEYSTVKRVYLSGNKAVREETVAKPQTQSINASSFEDKLLAEVCKPRSVAEMKQVAELATLLMNPAEPVAAIKPMPADMRSEESTKAPTTLTVAADAATPAAPRPRMIELPKIDKSQVEDPYKTGKPETEAKPAEGKKSAVATPAAPVTDHQNMAPTLSAYERRLIEQQLATTGPRRVVAKPKKKPVEEVVVHAEHIHWAYEGDGGPPNWGKLEEDFATCANGKRQSPIDIRDGIKVDLEGITFNYKASPFSVIDNGHTVQVSVAEGNSIRIMERTFNLIQFHFHRPSEERINGRSYDMVAHLVHKSDDGQLAVVAVLVEKGMEHPLIQTVWNYLPLEQGMLSSPAVQIDLTKLLPDNRAYWTYMGSLTTPPCTEGVLWMVLKQPIQLSPEQVSIFGRLYRNNARPVQPNNGRLIKENR